MGFNIHIYIYVHIHMSTIIIYSKASQEIVCILDSAFVSQGFDSMTQ